MSSSVAVDSNAPAGAGVATENRGPLDFLRTAVGRPVIVTLQFNSEIRGILICLDGFMNVVLEQAEEWVDGELVETHSECFIRGNTVLHITPKH